jgi:predicted aspartyl protease
VSLNESNAKVEANEEKISLNVNAVTEPKNVSSVMYAMSTQLNDSMIMIDVEIGDKTYKALIDSGSQITIMRKSVADELKLNIESYNGPEVKAVNGNKLQYYGEVSVKLSVKSENIKHSVIMPFSVVKELPADILLGFDTLSKLKINIDCSKRVFSINEN